MAASPRKLTVKQEAFVHAYIETGNASEAYRRAYNAENMKTDVIKVKACELLKNGNITVTLEELQSEAQERHEVTIESLTNELNDAMKIARDEKQGSAMVAAVTAKAKLHGMMVEKSVNLNHNNTIEDKPITKEEWIAKHSKSRTGDGDMETAGRSAIRLN